MPYNGSGTFVLAEAAFVPNTPISSSAMNSDLSDIATGLSTAVTKDGQTVITNPIRFASGSVGLPAITFSANTNMGFYRVSANNIGVSVVGAQVLNIAAAGLQIVSGQLYAAGTVGAPGYSFTGDLDSGIYPIGANNIGVGVNGAKVLDISATGLNVIGTVSSNGAVFAPQAAGAGMVNGTIVESRAGNAATYAIKTFAGTDPSASDPVYVPFRNVTPGTGNYSVLTLTSALSLVITSGSTLGAVSGVPFHLWFEIFNDGGTPRLGVIQNVSIGNIFPLGRVPIASSTAEGGAGGADSAQVFYTDSAVTSKAYAVIGYASYESGLVTAGAWNAAPTIIQLYGLGVPLPGQEIQCFINQDPVARTGTTAMPYDDSIPQSGEGDEYMTRSITPTSAANILQTDVEAIHSMSAGVQYVSGAMFQDATAGAVAASAIYLPDAAMEMKLVLSYRGIAGTSSSTTMKYRAGRSTGSGTLTLNCIASTSGRVFGGVANSFIRVSEFMT